MKARRRCIKGSLGCNRGTHIPGRNMESVGPPYTVILGEGWKRLSVNLFDYNSGTELNPSLDILPIVKGTNYNVKGECITLTGTLPKVSVIIGDIDAVVAGDITATGFFDYTAVAGSDNFRVRFLVDDNTSTLRATIRNITIEEVP